ncbi:MAG TPA: transglutaminase-like domain-containing protein [Methylomirabilota bacterium]|nr:transglutaminase-like domain-containing protein [Methylomirabilota bacterium]
MTIFLFFIFLSFIFPRSAFASTNFTTDYSVTYTVDQAGMTHAQLHGTLTNTTSQYYASSYKMQLGFDTISKVKASDPDGSITPSVTKSDDGYIIGLVFNKKSVGLGSKLPFTISFDTPTIAKQFGKVWEINIPGIANPDDFTSFTVNVVTPSSFGKPSYIKPNQPQNSLIFTKEQLGKSGISIAFGQQQLYAFSLTYHLKNDNLYPVQTEIALPPSTNYQEIYLTDITPRPSNVIEDKDGNWLAQYHLLPTQKVAIIVKGTTQINLTPKQQPLSSTDFNEYLKPQPYWETKDPLIKDLANELKTPQAIYDYVVKTLHYDFSRVTGDQPRLGALNALKEPNSAVCREFTDLFVAIARAAGIPAREVDGFAYTENAKQRPLSLVQDILHAWPEYYDKEKQTWIMVDPTWGSTTGGVDYFNVLDFDHFAFTIKGTDSNYPIPAGGYKLLANKNAKDIQVHFANAMPDNPVSASFSASFPKVSIAGFPLIGKVTITNTGSQKLSPQIISLTSTMLLPQNQSLATTQIPPFGYHTWDVGFRGTSFLTNTNASFTIRSAPDSELGSKTSEQTVKIAPFFLTLWGIGGIILGILAIILFIITIKIRRVRVLR